MFTLIATDRFNRWFNTLRDRNAKTRIRVRLLQIEQGNFGDHKSVGDGISELRIFVGPGYRIYYTVSGQTIVVLLTGGEKSSQQADISAAKKLAQEWKERSTGSD